MDNLPVINEENFQITPQVQSLIEIIHSEIESGMERARLAMEKERRQTYWNVGMYIKEHLLQNSERAEYGEYLFPVLAQELNIDRTILYRCVQCFEEYPQIVATSQQLTWSHITALLPIEDRELRQKYEQKIIEEKLPVKELRELIRKDKGIPEVEQDIPALVVDRGEPWVYRLKKVQDKTMVDLGFRFYLESPVQNLNIDSVVKIQKENQEYKFNGTYAGAVPHYTYKAYVIEVLDGDTLWVDIDLGFNTWTNQKIRLRGINSGEVESPDGKTAKDYIASKLKGCQFIAIKTYWRDKFTRYLADIFYDKKETDFETLVQNGKFLNQEILDKGLAVKYAD